MVNNHIWVIEMKTKGNWIPMLEFLLLNSKVPGVHYTRRLAREFKRVVINAKTYGEYRQYRVKKYESVD